MALDAENTLHRRPRPYTAYYGPRSGYPLTSSGPLIYCSSKGRPTSTYVRTSRSTIRQRALTPRAFKKATVYVRPPSSTLIKTFD